VRLTGQAADVVVHLEEITVKQIGRLGDPQLPKISGDSGADVRDVFETGEFPVGVGSFRREVGRLDGDFIARSHQKKTPLSVRR
jgi:hypothetical protein